MDANDSIQRQFLGFKETNFLWKDSLDGLDQFILNTDDADFKGSIEKRVRLGHLVEYFVQSEFESEKKIQVLGKNLQVLSGKQTLGEFDFFIEKESVQYHIEVVYKFYLYDESVGVTEIEHWIGPNRNDSLDQKTGKLKEKQFPLINRPESKVLLESIGVDVQNIEQRVYFKGKLFVPYGKETSIELLNPNCISGFYIRFDELDQFKNHKIYIPVKHDWLVTPYAEVTWRSHEEALVELKTMMEENRSPLVWFKSESGDLVEAFIVWW